MRFEQEDQPEVEDTVSEALAAFGLYTEGALEIDEDEFWLWPENEEPFWFWLSVQTQWVVGMAGAVGLNYAGVETCMRMQDIPKKKRRQLFHQVQLMEQAALAERVKQD